MLVCFGLGVYLYVGILCAKTLLGFSMDLSSSIRLENVGTSKLEAKNW